MAPPARAPLTPGSLHRRWTLACALAELLGLGVAAATAVGLAALWPAPASWGARLTVLAGMVAAGALEGLALGVLQGRVLRRRLGRLRVGEWAGPTVAVAALGWLAGMAGPVLGGGGGQGVEPPLALVLLSSAALGAGAGAVLGAVQALVLRHHAERAGRWVGLNALGWALAMPVLFAGAGVPGAGWPRGAVVLGGALGGLLGGAVLGAVTGLGVRALRPWVDERDAPLTGRVCAVTGANRGLGLEVARGLARLGARVVLLCRHEADASRAARALREVYRGRRADVQVVRCDLASLASVREAAAELRHRYERLDVLVHNAGATFLERHVSEDGIEATLATDVVGPFLLTRLLQDRLEAAHGRVVVLAGRSHHGGRLVFHDLHFSRRRYDWREANAQAQLARVLFVEELARRAPRLAVVAVHPGAVLTGALDRAPRWARLLAHTLARPGFVRPELGALPVLRLVTLPRLHALSGHFVDRFTPEPRPHHPRLAARLWRVCDAFTRPPRDAAAPLPPPSPGAMPHAL